MSKEHSTTITWGHVATEDEIERLCIAYCDARQEAEDTCRYWRDLTRAARKLVRTGIHAVLSEIPRLPYHPPPGVTLEGLTYFLANNEYSSPELSKLLCDYLGIDLPSTPAITLDSEAILRARRQVMVYVAGPFRADTPWEVELNVRRAEERAYMLAARGIGYVCPHLNGRFFDKTATDEYWLEMTKEQMRRCDVVWADVRMGSEGTEGELAEARREELPVILGALDVDAVVVEVDKVAARRMEYLKFEG